MRSEDEEDLKKWREPLGPERLTVRACAVCAHLCVMRENVRVIRVCE